MTDKKTGLTKVEKEKIKDERPSGTMSPLCQDSCRCALKAGS